MEYLLAGLIGPWLWWLLLGFILWLVRKFAPKWEKTLFMKIPNE